MNGIQSWLYTSVEILSGTFIIVIGVAAALVVCMFLVDIRQHKDAVRKNYPVLGRFRYVFTTLGEFFRQYFFAMDREEMPFNRAERDWIGRAVETKDNTIAFGSTKQLSVPGTIIFSNCPFPTLTQDATAVHPLTIGHFCEKPFLAQSFYNISAMSYGALSTPAVRALSHGAKLAGCWMNTGEGGLSPYHLEGGCDVVFQIGTAKYGVRDEDGNLSEEKLKEIAAYEQVRMFEIKLSQGAKPGKGGILPGIKVTEEISKIRGIPRGQDSISPNRHTDINGVTDLLDMVKRIRDVTQKPVGFKAVFGSFEWLEELCALIHERGVESAPDFITVDSGDGGTGAAPMPLMDNVGLVIKESLPLVANILRRYGLHKRVRLICSGKLVTPSEVSWALAVGADFVVSARGFMFSLGCIQAMKCNKNTCPTGITTHNKHLQSGLDPNDKKHKVANFCKNMIHEVEVISHSCGVTRPRLLQRKHVRIVQPNGVSIPLNELFPDEIVLEKYQGSKALKLI